mgnify:CR=1 FL=1
MTESVIWVKPQNRKTPIFWVSMQAAGCYLCHTLEFLIQIETLTLTDENCFCCTENSNLRIFPILHMSSLHFILCLEVYCSAVSCSPVCFSLTDNVFQIRLARLDFYTRSSHVLYREKLIDSLCNLHITICHDATFGSFIILTRGGNSNTCSIRLL